MSLKTLVAKEEEVIRAPPLLDRCVSPKVDKGEDLRMNSLIESQKWPVDFGSSGEVVVRDQGVEVWDGVDGASPSPLGVYPPDMHLDWAEDCEEDEAQLLEILDASVSEEEFFQESMVARQKTKENVSGDFTDVIEEDLLRIVKLGRHKIKGRRELLNLNNSINYGDASLSSRRGKGKAHML
jgi:hypothetical protein